MLSFSRIRNTLEDEDLLSRPKGFTLNPCDCRANGHAFILISRSNKLSSRLFSGCWIRGGGVGWNKLFTAFRENKIYSCKHQLVLGGRKHSSLNHNSLSISQLIYNRVRQDLCCSWDREEGKLCSIKRERAREKLETGNKKFINFTRQHVARRHKLLQRCWNLRCQEMLMLLSKSIKIWGKV